MFVLGLRGAAAGAGKSTGAERAGCRLRGHFADGESGRGVLSCGGDSQEAGQGFAGSSKELKRLRAYNESDRFINMA